MVVVEPSTWPAILGQREDLRHLPIVAIDPVDARDFDDAVWASPREDGGFDAIVAIDAALAVESQTPPSSPTGLTPRETEIARRAGGCRKRDGVDVADKLTAVRCRN